MTVRLLVAYGSLPKNALYTGSGEAEMLRDGRADTNTAAGVTFVSVPEQRWQTPVSLRVTGGLPELYADLRVQSGVNLSAESAVSVFPASQYATAPSRGFDASQSEVQEALLMMGGGPSKAPPIRATPYTHTGTTYFVDPTWGGAASGTFAAPYTNLGQVPALAANTAVLLKAGTTLTTSAFYEVSARGSSAVAAVVIGVYDPVSGQRIFNTQGAANVVCAAGANNFFVRIGESSSSSDDLFVMVDGLKITGANAAGSQGAIHVGNGGKWQVHNCEIASLSMPCINVPGRGGSVENCKLSTVDSSGIQFRGDNGNDPTISVAYNLFTSCGYVGILHNANFKFSGTNAYNTFIDGGDAVYLFNGGGAPQIYGNTMTRAGIRTDSHVALTNSADASGALIENNTITDCEFPIAWAQYDGKGTALIQFNRLLRAGSKDGGKTPANSSTNYGRGLEIYGKSAAFNTGGVVVRWNYVADAYDFITTGGNAGSEGVGIGCDNNAFNVRVYGNYVTGCEGNGIQLNRCGNGIEVTGNVCIGNAKYRAGTLHSPYAQPAEINIIVSRYARVYNNVTRSKGMSKFGIFVGGTPSETSLGTDVKNNLMVDHSDAGLVIDNTGSAVLESNNLVINSATLRLNQNFAPAAAGTSTVAGATSDIDASGLFIKPAQRGKADATGVAVMGSSFFGLPLAQRTQSVPCTEATNLQK